MTGTGLPSANNTHEVAQSVAPECRIVHVDNDSLVLAHALLTSGVAELDTTAAVGEAGAGVGGPA